VWLNDLKAVRQKYYMTKDSQQNVKVQGNDVPENYPAQYCSECGKVLEIHEENPRGDLFIRYLICPDYVLGTFLGLGRLLQPHRNDKHTYKYLGDTHKPKFDSLTGKRIS
jgi:hypothetical protein